MRVLLCKHNRSARLCPKCKPKSRKKLTDRERAARYTDNVRTAKPFFLSNIVTYMDGAYLAGLRAGRRERP